MGGDLLPKKIRIVVGNHEFLFETKNDYLTVYNRDSGELIVNDVKEGKENTPNSIETIAVFKNWNYWIDLTYIPPTK